MMHQRPGFWIAAAVAFVTLCVAPSALHAEADGVERTECDEPAGDPEEGTPEFVARDLVNQRCAHQRLEDEYGNPAFGRKFWVEETPGTYTDNVTEQLDEPTRPRGTLMQWIIGGRTADPFRIPSDWAVERGRGRVQEVEFILTSGAKTRGYVFAPTRCPDGGCPGIVITTGSIQGYQELYFWASEGLAEAGYMVLTFDVQGQGRGETFPHEADGSFACDPVGWLMETGGSDFDRFLGCEGVIFQQSENFFQGTRDALDFFLSSPGTPYGQFVDAADQTDPDNTNAAGTDRYNPLHAELDRTRIGLAGHSLGAGAVSFVGQERACEPETPRPERDGCVSAIVGWDAASVPGDIELRAPVLSLTAEYFFNTTPRFEKPGESEDGRLEVFETLVDAGIDAMRVAQRSSTHLEYTYVPYILPASRYGERVAMYYTLAWFDRYVRDDLSAIDRLTAEVFDGSSDESSIGAGTYNPATNSNVPYEIEGDCVANRLSIYFDSRFHLTDPGGAVLREEDMRGRGCPGS